MKTRQAFAVVAATSTVEGAERTEVCGTDVPFPGRGGVCVKDSARPQREGDADNFEFFDLDIAWPP